MKNSITVGEERRKYFYKTGLNFLSSVPQRRIQEMILAMAQKGRSGKMTDRHSPRKISCLPTTHAVFRWISWIFSRFMAASYTHKRREIERFHRTIEAGASLYSDGKYGGC